jgi:hypothetical protein
MRESAKKELVKEATESHAKKNWSRKQLNHILRRRNGQGKGMN